MSFEASVANEMHLIGAIMLNEIAGPAVLDRLTTDMFQHRVHQDILKVLQGIRSENGKLNVEIAASRLEISSRAIPREKWGDYLYDCGESTSASSIYDYAAELRTTWYKTRLRDLASRCDSMTMDQLTEETERIKHQAALVSRVREGGLKIFQKKKDVRGVASSIDIVNDESKVGGYPSGQVSIILARSGDGKSAFMIQETLNMISNRHPVLYITVADLNGEDVTDRLKQMATGWSDMPKHDPQREQYRQICKELGQMPITIRDASADRYGRTVEDVCSRIQMFTDRHKNGILPVVFVDYFQELTTMRSKEFRSSYERDMHISSELITVSKDTQIPIIVGSQITIADGVEKTKGGDFLNDRSGLTLRIKRYRDEAEKKGIDEMYKGVEGLGAIRINKSRFGKAWESVFVQFGKDLKLREL